MLLRFLISFLIGLLFGSLCSNLARGRGKNSLLWFQLGFFFGVFALLFFYLSLLKDRFFSRKMAKEAVSSSQGTQENESPPELQKQAWGLEARDWHYLDQSRQPLGPISFEELKKKIKDGVIHEKLTYLWTEGMEKWKPLNELPYLKMMLKEKTTS